MLKKFICFLFMGLFIVNQTHAEDNLTPKKFGDFFTQKGISFEGLKKIEVCVVEAGVLFDLPLSDENALKIARHGKNEISEESASMGYCTIIPPKDNTIFLNKLFRIALTQEAAHSRMYSQLFIIFHFEDKADEIQIISSWSSDNAIMKIVHHGQEDSVNYYFRTLGSWGLFYHLQDNRFFNWNNAIN